MTNWQFLLQKEGEKSWLPLSTHKLEVEAGRYRLVARTPYLSTPVEVGINYCDTTQEPPQSIIQKRSRQINSQGWMVVIPYVFLKPGSWELSCCPHEEDNPGDNDDNDSNLEVEIESNSQSWQEKVILEVTPSQPQENSVLSCGGTDNLSHAKVKKTPQSTDKITFVSSDFSPNQESSQKIELILGSDSSTDLVATPTSSNGEIGKQENNDRENKNNKNVDTPSISNSKQVKSVYLDLLKFTNLSPTLPKYPFFSPPLETTTELGIAPMGDRQEEKLIAVSTTELGQEETTIQKAQELTPPPTSDLGEIETSLDDFPPTSDLEETETSLDISPPTSADEKAQDQLAITPEMEQAFRALNLDQRFWLRLSSIAKDQESVVENGMEISSSVSLTSSTDNEVENPQEASVKDIPTPVLMVSEGDLEAGKPAFVRVKLPPDADSVYVRIWMQDRQTRYLLDQPRNLVQFTRNQQGELEALTQITVPLGSSQIHFEAIAIDMETQRESHKAMVDRIVIPADLPDVSWEEFED